MRKVRWIRREGQDTTVIAAELDALPVDAATVDSKVALIQALIPLGLLHVEASLQQELELLTGPRYARAGGQPGLVRYGRQAGSVYLADQKLPIQVPRVRDRQQNQEVPPSGVFCRQRFPHRWSSKGVLGPLTNSPPPPPCVRPRLALPGRHVASAPAPKVDAAPVLA